MNNQQPEGGVAHGHQSGSNPTDALAAKGPIPDAAFIAGLDAAIEKVEDICAAYGPGPKRDVVGATLEKLKSLRDSHDQGKEGHKSVTELCADHPNLMEYVGQLERTNDQWNRQLGEMRDHADSLCAQLSQVTEERTEYQKETVAVRLANGRLTEERDNLRVELAALKSPWIPAPGLPTKNDADSAVRVLWLTWCPQTFNPIIVHGGVHSPPWNWTHWMTPVLPPLPQPDPAEGAFEKWWEETYPDSLNYELARSAWNAAQQKGKS